MIPSPFSLSLALVAALAGQTLAQGADNKAAGAAAPPVVAGANADSSGLPSGVTSFKPQDPSPFCRQFKDVPAGNGTQLKTGGRSCSSTPMGLIPDVSKMVSTIIVEPKAGSTIDASVENKVRIDIVNMVAGFFNLANEQYYLAPQTLNPQLGTAEGHQHITVQKMEPGARTAPDPKVFAFFKGINNAATDPEKRSLEAVIPPNALKEQGTYRICSITGADAHQPLLMPVLRRGPQDDCIRIQVTNTAGGANQKIAADNSQSNNVQVNGQKINMDVKAATDKKKDDAPAAQGNNNNQQQGNSNNGNQQQNNNQPAAPPAAANGNIDFGSCKPPTIRFGLNIDGRKETAFEVVNKDSFTQSSAQNGNIIVRALCDQLRDRCKAPKATQDLCIPAAAAFAAQPDKTGAQADAFNKVFGITTNFKEIQPRDNQGNPIGAAPAAQGNNNNNNQQQNNNNQQQGNNNNQQQQGNNNNQPAAPGAADNDLIAKCKLPAIEFGAGFQGRRETSFQIIGVPGTAQNGAIIIERICNQAQGDCKTLCLKGADAFKALPPKTGAQADAFNKIAAGKTTNFAAIAPIA